MDFIVVSVGLFWSGTSYSATVGETRALTDALTVANELALRAPR
jgi:hypothetical protein